MLLKISEVALPYKSSLPAQSSFPTPTPIVNVEDNDEELSLETNVFDMLVSSFQGQSSTTNQPETSSTTSVKTSSTNPAIVVAAAVAKSILETISEELEESKFEADKQASIKGKELLDPENIVLPPLPSDDCPKTPPPPVSEEGYNVESMIITSCVPNLVMDTNRAGTSVE